MTNSFDVPGTFLHLNLNLMASINEQTFTSVKIHVMSKVVSLYETFFDAYSGPYKDKCHFWSGILLLVHVVLALVMSLDTEAVVSLDMLTSIFVVVIFMYFLLRGVY